MRDMDKTDKKKKHSEPAERKKRDREGVAEKLMEIAREYREQFPGPLPTREEMDDFLYDENGLPR
jgi:hypothetical protein